MKLFVVDMAHFRDIVWICVKIYSRYGQSCSFICVDVDVSRDYGEWSLWKR
jgi:hypothetical protein